MDNHGENGAPVEAPTQPEVFNPAKLEQNLFDAAHFIVKQCEDRGTRFDGYVELHTLEGANSTALDAAYEEASTYESARIDEGRNGNPVDIDIYRKLGRTEGQDSRFWALAIDNADDLEEPWLATTALFNIAKEHGPNSKAWTLAVQNLADVEADSEVVALACREQLDKEGKELPEEQFNSWVQGNVTRETERLRKEALLAHLKNEPLNSDVWGQTAIALGELKDKRLASRMVAHIGLEYRARRLAAEQAAQVQSAPEFAPE